MTTHIPAHGWQLAEGSAYAYERFLVPTFMDRWAADLVDAAGVKPGQRVLDVACGTGIVARHAAARVDADGEVTGVDINASMLAVAREHTPADGTIRWEEADAADLPLPDAHFDVVLCQQGLQFFGEQPAAIAELHRVTTPGGRLALTTCRSIAHQPGHALLAEVLTRHVGVAVGDALRSPFALGDDERLRELVTAVGYRDVRLRIAVWPARFASAVDFLRAETASSPLGEVVDALDADVQTALVDDLTASLRPHTDDEGVTFPIETIVVTATR